MRFVFLGTGTSAGVPAIGCDCAVCTSADPRDQRLRTSGLIQFRDPRGQERAILIDAGPDLRQQVLRCGLRRLDAILFTHNHVDHTFGLDEVRRFNVVMERAIDVYADDRTMEHLRRVFRHIFERDANVNDSFVATLIPHRIDAGEPFTLHGLRVTPIPLLHGKLSMLGFRFDAEPGLGGAREGLGPGWLPMAYCTDLSGVPTDSWRILKGVRTLVLDALRHRRHPTHLTLGQAVSIAHEVGAERTYFVHMAHDLAHQATCDQLPEGMALAHDGLVLE
jgi:phosphoribosyl 1,2-cyclic phosphate phosphodiesterase